MTGMAGIAGSATAIATVMEVKKKKRGENCLTEGVCIMYVMYLEDYRSWKVASPWAL